MKNYDPPRDCPCVKVTRAEVAADTDCERRPVWAAMAQVLDRGSVDPARLIGIEDAMTDEILRGGEGVYHVILWANTQTLTLSRLGSDIVKVSLYPETVA